MASLHKCSRIEERSTAKPSALQGVIPAPLAATYKLVLYFLFQEDIARPIDLPNPN
jgi:hypothetical protein